MSTPSFEARMVRGAGLRDELEIVYDGTSPPSAFFDDLRAIGWEPPVLSPPPAAAIDWSRPDPRTGTRYTLRSYEAIGRAVAGPAAQDVAVVERVIARHQAPDPPVAPPVVAPTAPVPEPVAPVVASAPPPPPAAAAPVADETTREREVQVGATLDEASAPIVRDQLTQRGLVVRSTRMSLTSPGGYRGATTADQQSAVRLQFRVPISQIDEVVGILGPEASDVVVRR